jgi:hypothetical protein
VLSPSPGLNFTSSCSEVVPCVDLFVVIIYSCLSSSILQDLENDVQIFFVKISVFDINCVKDAVQIANVNSFGLSK